MMQAITRKLSRIIQNQLCNEYSVMQSAGGKIEMQFHTINN
jgi:hypothetical protein